MSDEHSASTVHTLTPTDSVSEFQEELIQEGPSGLEKVCIPWSDHGVTDRERSIPTETHAPLSEVARTALSHAVENSDMRLAHLTGSTDPTPALVSFASQREIPYITLDLSRADVGSIYGRTVLDDGCAQYIPGTLAVALWMTMDGPVILHVEGTSDEDSMEDQSRSLTAILRLVGEAETIEFDNGEDVMTADLSNMTVVTTDLEQFEDRNQTPARYPMFPASDTEMTRIPQPYDFTAEATFLEETIGLDTQVANAFAEAADVLRNAAESADSCISFGPSSYHISSWAQTALVYHNKGVENAAVKAGEEDFINPLYSDQEVRAEVESILRDHVEGVFEKGD